MHLRFVVYHALPRHMRSIHASKSREILGRFCPPSHASPWLLHAKESLQKESLQKKSLRKTSNDPSADYNACADRTAHPWGMHGPSRALPIL